MDKRHIALAVSLVVLASGGAWWWTHARVTPMQAATIQRETSVVDRSDLSGVADLAINMDPMRPPGAARTSAVVELPPANMPLVDSFTVLDAEARRGNATAACRLGAELARCKRLRMFQTWAVNDEQETRWLDPRRDEATIERRINEVAERTELLESVARTCADVEQLPSQEVARYFAVAARKGHVPSMVEYLGAAHMGAGTLMRDPSFIAEYRRDASSMLPRALASGDPDLLQRIVNAVYLPDHTPLSSILPPEWLTIGFITALLQELPAEVLKTRLPGTQIDHRIPVSDTEREAAAQVYADYFAGITALQKSETTGRPVDWMRESLSTEQLRCDDATAFQP